MTDVVLGIETSCDECSAAVVTEGLKVLSLATHSQIALHQPFGGVVPEVASRNHLETIQPMIDQALKDAGVSEENISAIAVTNRPGLVGALLVGVTAAKAIAYALGKPLVPVHHLEGHALSVFLDQKIEPQYPLLILLASGGHTQMHFATAPPSEWPIDFLERTRIGRSRDDAAGEAFDKIGKLLGFPYPAGKWIDEAARQGNPKAFDLPRALPQRSTLDFSFSGIKTAASLLIAKEKQAQHLEKNRGDLCASVQEAIIDALLRKVFLAIKEKQCKSLAVVGGVAANSRLKARLSQECPVPVFTPVADYCTDNAAMIAAAGLVRFQQNHFFTGNELLKLNAIANPHAHFLAT